MEHVRDARVLRADGGLLDHISISLDNGKMAVRYRINVALTQDQHWRIMREARRRVELLNAERERRDR